MPRPETVVSQDPKCLPRHITRLHTHAHARTHRPWETSLQASYDAFAKLYRDLELELPVPAGTKPRGALAEGGNGLAWLCKAVGAVDKEEGC